MPLASLAELDGTTPFIFNEMTTLLLCWLLALDGCLGEGQNVSFTRWGVEGMRVGGRKPGRVSVSLPSTSTLSAWTPQCQPCAASPQSRPIFAPTICYNGSRS